MFSTMKWRRSSRSAIRLNRRDSAAAERTRTCNVIPSGSDPPSIVTSPRIEPVPYANTSRTPFNLRAGSNLDSFWLVQAVQLGTHYGQALWGNRKLLYSKSSFTGREARHMKAAIRTNLTLTKRGGG